jgi:hypothetical protein
MIELRCDNGILYGILVEEDVIEIKCRSQRCGASAGTVVLHRFSTVTGELLSTCKFAEPPRGVTTSAIHHDSASIRTA